MHSGCPSLPVSKSTEGSMQNTDHRNSLNRRTLVKGAAWATPVIVASSAAPAMASSRCPGGFNEYSYSVSNPTQSGSDGFLNTVAFWVTVYRTPIPEGCTTQDMIDNSGNYSNDTGATVRVGAIRAAGSTTRIRSLDLTQANPNYTNVIKTLDVADARPYAIGKYDYQWEITFAPGEVYTMTDSRFYVTISAGDGGVIDGRIKHRLMIDGKVTPTGSDSPTDPMF